MESWIHFRTTVLDELVRHDGLQDYDGLPTCAHCLDDVGTLKCLDCVQVTLYCATCIVQRHEHLPLHRVEVRLLPLVDPPLTSSKVWKDGYYQRSSLLELGLCFHVGHQHSPCPSANSCQQIIVIHLNGAHRVDVQFCTCKQTPNWVENYRQLLRVGWYPASFERPRTAFTFDLLDTYHKLTLQGKLNLYDFYSSVMQRTNNCGQRKEVVSLPNAPIALIPPDEYASLPSTGTTRSLGASASGAI